MPTACICLFILFWLMIVARANFTNNSDVAISIVAEESGIFFMRAEDNGRLENPGGSRHRTRIRGVNSREQTMKFPWSHVKMKPGQSLAFHPMQAASNPEDISVLNTNIQGAKDREGGVKNAVFCFSSGDAEMCMHVDLNTTRMTVVARQLDKESRKGRAVVKGPTDRQRSAPQRMAAAKSWQDHLKETFWPGEHKNVSRSNDSSLSKVFKDILDVLMFKNLTLWRNSRWEQAMQATRLGTSEAKEVSSEYNAMLQKPSKQNVSQQVLDDILFLHKLLQLTKWPAEQKWKGFVDGLKYLIPRKPARDYQQSVGEEDHGRDDTWPHIKEMPYTMRRRRISDDIRYRHIRPPLIHSKRYGRGSKRPFVRDENVIEKSPSFLAQLMNRNVLGMSPMRLALFAETTRLSNLPVEARWDVLTLGFRLFINGSKLKEQEIQDVVTKFPEPALNSTFHDNMNSMILVDLITFNRSGDYYTWIRLKNRRPPITAALVMSRSLQRRLRKDPWVRAALEGWYDSALKVLILFKLSILKLNNTYSKETDGFLSRNLSEPKTAEMVKEFIDNAHRENVSAAVITQEYDKLLNNMLVACLYLLNDHSSIGVKCAKGLLLNDSQILNDSKSLGLELDKIADKIKEINISDTNQRVVDELVFLKLLTITNSSFFEAPWRDLLVMKWSNDSGREAAKALSFAMLTVSVLHGFVYSTVRSYADLLIEEMKKEPEVAPFVKKGIMSQIQHLITKNMLAMKKNKNRIAHQNTTATPQGKQSEKATPATNEKMPMTQLTKQDNLNNGEMQSLAQPYTNSLSFSSAEKAGTQAGPSTSLSADATTPAVFIGTFENAASSQVNVTPTTDVTTPAVFIGTLENAASSQVNVTPTAV